jgi:uncharacterized OB-fold protein
MSDKSLLAAAAQLIDQTPQSESLSSTLKFQHCLRCAYVRYPEAPICPECLSHESEWRADTGSGTIWSWCVYHRVYNDAFAEALPYNVALVELDSGPRVISNVLNAVTPIRIGDRVIATPREVAPGRFLLYFVQSDEGDS